MVELNNKSRPKTQKGKQKKRDACDSLSSLFEGW